jgi:outer membrane receptor protein involved in Fe transport
MLKKSVNPIFSAVLAFAALLAVPAFAQQEQTGYDDESIIEEIIVTGTRIVSEDGFGRTSPVTVVDMGEISSFGFTRVEDILNNLPQIEADQTSMVSNGSSGTANINLRGLGAKRTLVLINGRRLQPGGVYSQEPDINQIPAQMIERVEVLTGGASATYGADAVAGVVNFIMRRVDGVEISVGIDGYQHNNNNSYIQGLMDERGFEYPTGNTGIDGKGYNINLVIGGDFANGRGNATAYINWRKNDELLQAARDYSSCALDQSGTFCGGSVNTVVPNYFIAPLTEDGLGPYGYDFFQEEWLALQPDSSLLPNERTNRYNYAPINHYMRPDERWSMGAFADYEFNRHAEVYLELMGFNDYTRAQIAESGTFFAEVYPLPLSNAYFPENFRKSLQQYWPGEDEFGLWIGKRNVEGGPRTDVLEHNSFRIVSGVRGLLAGEWDYDISYLHAQTSSTSTYINDFFAPRIATAVDSSLCEADRACIPYQVFTYDAVTQEAADNIAGTAISTSSTATKIFQAYVTGDSGWGLPAGSILAAAGYEHRKVEFERLSDNIYEEGLLLGQGLKVESLGGGYSVDELFIEVNVPLLADRAFARNMTLDLAYRWSDYSTSGQSSTYRFGLDWQTVDWMRLRAGYNHAVRAPNIGELQTPQQIGGFGPEDYCTGTEPVYSFEQCARTGVTAEQYGNIFEPPEDFNNSNVLYGGNPLLEPEEADTVTAGVVFETQNSMRLSLDYWDIKIDGVIDTIEPEITFDLCAFDGRLCQLIQRSSTGSLWLSKEGYIISVDWNLGQQHSSGIDVGWAWSLGTNWQFDLIGTYYLKKETTVLADDPDSSFDCAGLVSDVCFPTPEWRHTASATYDSGSFWAITGRWRFYGGVTYEGEIDQIADDNLNAHNYFDLSAVFRFMETHDVVVGVNNILDQDPPLTGSTLGINGNTVAGYYDTLGRFLFARATLRW